MLLGPGAASAGRCGTACSQGPFSSNGTAAALHVVLPVSATRGHSSTTVLPAVLHVVLPAARGHSPIMAALAASGGAGTIWNRMVLPVPTRIRNLTLAKSGRGRCWQWKAVTGALRSKACRAPSRRVACRSYTKVEGDRGGRAWAGGDWGAAKNWRARRSQRRGPVVSGS